MSQPRLTATRRRPGRRTLPVVAGASLLILVCAAARPTLAATPAGAGPALKTITVNCAAGDSINKALSTNAQELIINISGMCVEDVVVRRDRVTLRGTNPASDGIRAATTSDPFGAALFVRAARRVHIENLTITGGRYAGLLVEDTRRNVFVSNCWIAGNQQSGMLIANGLAVGTDLSIMGNGISGVAVSETGLLTCNRCLIADNPGPTSGFGVIASVSSLVRLNDGSITAGVPLSARLNSFAVVRRTTLNGSIAVDASSGSNVSVDGSLLDGAIRALDASQIKILNAQQLSNPASNFASAGSQLIIGPQATLVGQTTLAEFAQGIFQGGVTLDDLVCGPGAVAVCAPGVQKASSTCSSCP